MVKFALPGEMNQLITIQEKGTPARDAAGGETITWTDVASVWAKEVPYSGREFMNARREYAELYTRFSIYYRSDIKPTMRITKDSDSRVFQILSVANVASANRDLLITCKELIDS